MLQVIKHTKLKLAAAQALFILHGTHVIKTDYIKKVWKMLLIFCSTYYATVGLIFN